MALEFFSTNKPNPHQWSLNSCFVAFHNVWVHLVLFHYRTELGIKKAELVQLIQKFKPRCGVGVFPYEHTRFTPMVPKLMFLCVSYCFGAFGIVSLLHKTRSKMGRTGTINANVHAMKSQRNFTQRTQLIHTIGPQTHVLVRFIMLRCIWDRFVTTRNSVQNGQTGAINAKVDAGKWRWNFSARINLIHTNGP